MSPAVPAVLAAGAVLVWALGSRPVGADRLAALLPPSESRSSRPGPLSALGGFARRVLGREPDAPADRRVGGAILVGAVLVLVFPPMAMLWIAGVAGWSLLRRRRARARAEQELLDELPEVLDLLLLAVSAGLTVPLAVGVVADRGQGRLAHELGRARRAAGLGSGLADALDEVPHRLGEQVRAVTGVLAASLRDGTPVADAIERVAGEVRTQRRRAAEERARKVSVRLLFPLVCCVLPAFALLTVVPLLAGALSGIVL